MGQPTTAPLRDARRRGARECSEGRQARGELAKLSETELSSLRERVGRLVAELVVELMEVPHDAKLWGFKELCTGSYWPLYSSLQTTRS